MLEPKFQSTPPVKAATPIDGAEILKRIISIHAAREGGDYQGYTGREEKTIFQSTPPVKAATI